MNDTTTTPNSNAVIKFAVKQILVATNALEQKGNTWTLNLESNVIGIQPSATFTSQEAAVDAVAQTLATQFQKAA